MNRLLSFTIALITVLCFHAAVSSADLAPENQTKLMKHVDTYASRMSEVALKIWSMPELGYQETKTSALLQDELKKAGFKVEAGVAGIPTAFVARTGPNHGPGIDLFASLDGPPEVSQGGPPASQAIAEHTAP